MRSTFIVTLPNVYKYETFCVNQAVPLNRTGILNLIQRNVGGNKSKYLFDDLGCFAAEHNCSLAIFLNLVSLNAKPKGIALHG